jgi:flagellar basal-body rod protein FlgC
MNELANVLAISASGMKAQSGRLRFLSENIANADTPGYRRKSVSFENELEAGRPTGMVRPGPVQLDQTPVERIFDPGNPLADETGYYDGSNVNLVVEIADMREAQRSYEANLKLFDQARQMSQGLLQLLRR